MFTKSDRNNPLYYALVAFIGFTCCVGQSCSPSSLPLTSDPNTNEQVLGYQPDLPPSGSETDNKITGSGITSNETSSVPPPNPSLVISASTSEGTAPLIVTFSAGTGDGLEAGKFTWNFGDNATAEGQTVTHTFTSAAIYAVSLCFLSSVNSGSDPVCTETSITVDDQPVTVVVGGAGGGGGGGSTPTPNPQAHPQSLVIAENDQRTVELAGTENNGLPLTFLITVLPTHGVLNDPANGYLLSANDLPYVINAGWNAIIYIPTTNYEGSDHFNFAVNNGLVSSPAAAVNITISSSTLPTYRTLVAPITPSRWLNPVSVPQPGVVNRDNYMAYFRHYYDHELQYADSIRGTTNGPNQDVFARREAFFYHISGLSSAVPLSADEHAHRAMEFLAGEYAYYTQGPGYNDLVDWGILLRAGQAYLWIKDSPVLTAADHTLAENLLILLDQRHMELRKDPGNSSMGIAVGRKIVSILYPNETDAAERNAYCQEVWDSWWTYRDTYENCTPYNSLWFHYVSSWIAATDTEALYQDAGFKHLTERMLMQATPLGPLPSYGDATGFTANTEPGRWIALFEKWATVYNDGRYKWVAHRTFEWVTQRQQDMDQWGNVPVWMADALTDAWLAADDSIPEVKPTTSGVLTSRKAMLFTSTANPLPQGYSGILLNQDIPDKLILRSGWDAENLYAMVELAPEMAHGHGDTGSISFLSDQGSVLLATPPYLVKDQRFHNGFQLIRPGPIVFHDWQLSQVQTSVPVMADSQLATYAQVHIVGYLGQPAVLDRKIFFVKNLLIWVQDTLNVSETMQAKVGPAWQTVAMYPKKGSNWVNICLTSIPVPAIWDLYYLMQWTNIPRDLLVTFLPDTPASLQIDDVTYDDTHELFSQNFQNNMKYRLWYQTDTTLQPGTPVRFNSVLTPHAPEPDSTSLANASSLVVNTTDSTVVRIVLSPTRTLWLGINDGGNAVQTGSIQTNARQFLVDIDTNDGVQFWVVDATDMTINGQQLHATAQRETSELLR